MGTPLSLFSLSTLTVKALLQTAPTPPPPPAQSGVAAEETAIPGAEGRPASDPAAAPDAAAADAAAAAREREGSLGVVYRLLRTEGVAGLYKVGGWLLK